MNWRTMLDGDRIVALLGVVMAMILVSRSARLQTLLPRRKLLLGAVWAVMFGVVAALAGFLSRGSG